MLDLSDLVTVYHVNKETERLLQCSRTEIVISALHTMDPGSAIGMTVLAAKLKENMPHAVSVKGWYESIRNVFKQKHYKEAVRPFRRVKDSFGNLIIHRKEL